METDGLVGVVEKTIDDSDTIKNVLEDEGDSEIDPIAEEGIAVRKNTFTPYTDFMENEKVCEEITNLAKNIVSTI